MYGIECVHLTKTELDKLESMQRNLAKWILGHDRNSAGIAAITELGWKSMHHRYELKKVLMYGRLKYEEMEDSRWVRKAFIEAQAQKGNTWWSDVCELTNNMCLDDKISSFPVMKQSMSKVKKIFKEAFNEKYISIAKEEIKDKSTLSAFPLPNDKKWFQRSEYIENNIGSKMISKIRAGNYGVGNTYKKVKKCILCEGKNNESHLIMKCPELAVARVSTNILILLKRTSI